MTSIGILLIMPHCQRPSNQVGCLEESGEQVGLRNTMKTKKPDTNYTKLTVPENGMPWLSVRAVISREKTLQPLYHFCANRRSQKTASAYISAACTHIASEISTRSACLPEVGKQCLQSVKRRGYAGIAVLDIGTGTGLLALLSARVLSQDKSRPTGQYPHPHPEPRRIIHLKIDPAINL